MARTARDLRRSRWLRGLMSQLRFSLGWAVAVVAVAFAISKTTGLASAQCVETRCLPDLVVPSTGEVETAVQVVPAIVVAIFVFAAGTSFVVAQVVPQSRGTRAVEVLRRRHLAWTIAPALALTPMSALVLALEQDAAWPLAAALLLGSAAYLLISTGCLLNILAEATNPLRFAALLKRQHLAAVCMFRAVAAAGADTQTLTDRARYRWARVRSWGCRERRRRQAVEDLYDVLRTLRGWARSSATVGDSRELYVALEGTLDVVASYAKLDRCHRRGVPQDYDDSASAWRRSALRQETAGTRVYTGAQNPWELWVPPPCPHDPGPRKATDDFAIPKDDPQDTCKVAELRKQLEKIWVANEVGRSIVRAVEFATTTQTLLDRDRARLLLSLEKVVRRFAEHNDALSAGVAVGYLIELGLGVRRCSPADIDWHFEPLSRLTSLHRDPPRPRVRDDADPDPDLAIGVAAGILKVLEAIASARVNEYHSGRPMEEVDPKKRPVIALAVRTVADLRNLVDVGNGHFYVDAAKLPDKAPDSQHDAPDSPEDGPDSPDEAPKRPDQEPRVTLLLSLAAGQLLDPRDQAVVRPTDTQLLSLVFGIVSDPKEWRQEQWTSKAATAQRVAQALGITRTVTSLTGTWRCDVEEPTSRASFVRSQA